MTRRGLAALLAALSSGLLALPVPAAPLAATVTIVDGEAVLLRGVAKAALAEGVRLAAGDIVETAAAARLLRLELDDGLAVDLGPATRLQFGPRLVGEANRRVAPLYLLRGWAKLSAAKSSGEGVLLATPALDLVAPLRSAVLSVEPEAVAVFAETGELSFISRRAERVTRAVTLKAGEFYARQGSEAATVGPRPSPAFLQRVPRPFLDPLPARAKQFAGREAVPRPLGPIAWADAQPWIDAEPALRGGFVLRWRVLARQPEFRRRLQEGLAAHPEWDRLLNPEKFLPAAASAAPR